MARRVRSSTRHKVMGTTVAIVGMALLAAACGSDDSGSASTTTTAAATTTTQDPVTAAQAQVTTAQANLTKANDAFTAAGKQFCTDAKSYVTVLDRYGKLFTDSKATVGDVKTMGADLIAPKDTVTASASAAQKAKADVATAQQALADAQNALAAAVATASSVAPPTTVVPPTTTTLIPQVSIDRVKQAESELASTAKGITDATPLVQASAAYNSAAFALEVSWLKLLADANCLTDDQQAKAVQQVTDYTVALQTELQQAGYYKGAIDGIYGPQTVDAVKQLQTDSGLRVTGLVDKSTAAALDKKLAAMGQQAAAAAMTQTAALQTVLTLTGFWTGPIDGQWTDELTTALMNFQTKLGVPATGVVDAATLAAFQTALANLKNSTTTTTTAAPATTSAPATTTPATTVAATTTT